MSKKRVHEIAKELGVTSKEVMTVLQQHNIPAKAAVSSVDEKGYEVVKAAFNKGQAPKATATVGSVKETPKTESKAAHKHSAGSDYRKHRNEQRHNQMAAANRVEKDGQVNGHKPAKVASKVVETKMAQQVKESKVASQAKEVKAAPQVKEAKAAPQVKDTRNNDRHDNRNDGRKDKGRNDRNDTRNDRNDNRSNDRNNDRKNKKNKNKNKGGNRPQSLVASSMKKKKDRVKHRNEQYVQQKEEERRRAEAAIATEIELSGSLTVGEFAEMMGRPTS